jgi:hypothetical protein
MCKQSGESVDHLLLHCPLAWELWSMVLGLFGVHWEMPCRVLDLWAGWRAVMAIIEIWFFGGWCPIV